MDFLSCGSLVLLLRFQTLYSLFFSYFLLQNQSHANILKQLQYLLRWIWRFLSSWLFLLFQIYSQWNFRLILGIYSKDIDHWALAKNGFVVCLFIWLLWVISSFDTTFSCRWGTRISLIAVPMTHFQNKPVQSWHIILLT